ncbi:MAG: hypothetical protein IJ348_07235 [Alistipes sp.]|nr:hypothetical protein [Alistipes sp.]
MKYFPSIVTIAVLLFATPNAEARSSEKNRAEVLAKGRGFYKDVFMDGGIALTSRHSLPATTLLGLSMEYFASASVEQLSERDTTLQTNILCGSEQDTNGWLLYPDGAPRFRAIYVNGGSAAKHAKSLGSTGRERLQEYVANGGSYVGTCAGAFIASAGSINTKGELKNTKRYWQLWPGYAESTGLRKSATTLRLERRSPLARYFDFEGGRDIADVRHNGGCYAHTEADDKLPEGTEPLARFLFDNTAKVGIDGEVAIWAYKQSDRSGRVILCGSHPEGATKGERLKLMASMLLYAMEGNPKPQIKGTLSQGEVREMNRRTEDNDPDHTRIGDRQYHHFRVDVPNHCKELIINIDGYEEAKKFDLSLCAKRGEAAFHDNTLLKSVGRGCRKSLTIKNPKAGAWYLSVFCETTVSPLTGKYGTTYKGKTSVLNGVPYKVSIQYK